MISVISFFSILCVKGCSLSKINGIFSVSRLFVKMSFSGMKEPPLFNKNSSWGDKKVSLKFKKVFSTGLYRLEYISLKK